MRRWILAACMGILTLLLIIPPAIALSTIPEGGTVFIGEEGLDITACGIADGDTLGWFEAGRAPATHSPTVTTTVSDADSFYISPSTFSGRTGTWYNIATGNPAFIVSDPYLEIRIYDVDYGQIDRTGLWVPMDFELQFRITTNLNAMAQRPGVAGAPIEIRVIERDGIEYSSLTNRAGVTTPLLLDVDRSPYMTGRIWYPDAGYSRGVYDFYAFCNANRMKDNYEVTGKTITPRTETITLSREITPTITTPTPTITPVTPTPTVTETPAPPITPDTPEPPETPTPTVTPTPEPASPLAVIPVAALGLALLLRVRK